VVVAGVDVAAVDVAAVDVAAVDVGAVDVVGVDVVGAVDVGAVPLLVLDLELPPQAASVAAAQHRPDRGGEHVRHRHHPSDHMAPNRPNYRTAQV
jgi:hypothetical protein